MSKEQSAGSTHRESAEEEAFRLNRFIYRDYKKRLFPLLSRATKEFEYRQPTYGTRSARDSWGNKFYRFDDTPKLVSPLLFSCLSKPGVLRGWQVEVDAPPTWSSRLLLGSLSSHQLTLREMTETQADSETSIVSEHIYPLKWAELNRDQVVPEDPNDELYMRHSEVLRSIRMTLDATKR